jgi:hypothetical protein
MHRTMCGLPPPNHSLVNRLGGEAVGEGLQLGDALALGLQVAQKTVAALD